MFSKIALALITSLLAVNAQAAIKSSGTGINLNTVKPTWSNDPGYYAIKKNNEEITNSYLVNAGSSISISPAFLTGDAAFSVTTDGCGSALTTTNCTIDVKFNSAGKANGRYASILTVGDLDIPLTAVVAYANPNPSYKVVDSLGQVVSQINMGTHYKNHTRSRYVYVIDVNKATTSDLSISSSSAEIVNSASTCSAASLNSNTGCSVTVTMSSSLSPGSYSGTLSVGSVSIGLVGEVQASANRPLTSSYVLESSSGRVLSAIDFGLEIPGSNIAHWIFFRDLNSRSTASSSNTLSGSGFHMTFGNSGCSSSSMNDQDGCNILMWGDSLTEGTHTASLTTGANSVTYPISRVLTRSLVGAERKVVMGDYRSYEETRILKLGSFPALGSGVFFSVPFRDVNKVSYDGEPVTFSMPYVYTVGVPGFTIVSGSSTTCTQGSSFTNGCEIRLKFNFPNAALGKYSEIITMTVGGKTDTFIVEIDIY